MKNDNECELIQDLLLNYADGVLNHSSKALVDEHIKTCSNCKKKLEDLKNDANIFAHQEKEIDYLKKLRRKTRIKSIIGSIIIIIVITLIYFFSKFFILNDISEKAEKQFSTENFYIEEISKLPSSEPGVSVKKTWYKDGKYKTVSYIETEKDGIIQTFDTRYGTVGQKELYEINENSKMAKKIFIPFENKKSDLLNLQNPIFTKDVPSYMFLRLGSVFHTKISTDHRQLGKKYYVLELGEGELWVDIDTGLPLMSWGYSGSVRYYKDTGIPIESFKSIFEYKYDFNSVTDSDVSIPDLTEYNVSEDSSMLDTFNDAISNVSD